MLFRLLLDGVAQLCQTGKEGVDLISAVISALADLWPRIARGVRCIEKSLEIWLVLCKQHARRQSGHERTMCCTRMENSA